MSDINPYRPAVNIAPADDSRHNDDGGWIFRRLAGASSALGTLLVAVSVPGFIAGEYVNSSLSLMSGLGLIASGYYWYGREFRTAVRWSLISFCAIGVLIVYAS